MPEFSFGTDPEFMILNEIDKHVSAIGIVPGTRDDRHTYKGHEFFYDNVLAECAIRPGETKEEAIENIREALQHYTELIYPFRLKPQASHDYDKSQLQHQDAIDAGCSADECAYQLMVMEPEVVIAFLNGETLRSCGGHVHLGTTVTASQSYGGAWLTRVLDLFLGVPSIFLDKDPTSLKRKEIYGQPGRYRKTDYGIEYRTPGNFWLASPKLVEITHDLCACAIQFMDDGEHMEFWHFDEHRLHEDEFWETDGNIANLHHCTGYDPEQLCAAITNMDQHIGKKFMELINFYIPKGLQKRIAEAANDKEPNFYKEWNLK